MTKTLKRAALGALLVLAAAPATASAAFTHTVSLSTAEAGCYPKGPSALPLLGAPGAVLNGNHTYQIEAVVNGAKTAPCRQLPLLIPGAAGNYAVQLQWQATPEASAYNVYRDGALRATLPADGPTCPASNAGQRCQLIDGGQPASGGEPRNVPAQTFKAGTHPDLNINQTFSYTPASPNGGPDSASLKDNVLHFPAGLLANPTAAKATCSLTQLIGAPATNANGAGTQDTGEDKCPRASQVGTVFASIQSGAASAANPPTPAIGDIYIGQKIDANDNVTARLFVALRPPCSQGYPVPLNPGGAACSDRISAASGGALTPAQAAGFEIEKSFLSAKATIRQDGTFGIDNETTSVAAGHDEDLAPSSNLRNSTTGTKVGAVPIQVRAIIQNLWGSADQNTATIADDVPFVYLPTSCAAKTFSSDAASYLDPTPVSAQTALQATNCESVPFSPQIVSTLDTSGGNTGQNGHPGFVARIAQSENEAATRTAVVTLPKGLGTNIAALSRACTAAQQATGCPASSIVGSAEATVPVLPGVLAGPVYLAENNSPYNVSGLPKLIVALEGAAKITFDGAISFNADNTRLINTFNDLPEVTLSSFKLAITGGDGGLLQNTQDLCTKPLGKLDASFVGWNGAGVTRNVPVASNQEYYCVSKPPAKKKPGLSLKVKPGKDKAKPFKFTAKGKVDRKGVAKGKACKGKVKVTIKKGDKKLAKKMAKVKSSCEYKATLKLNNKKAGGKGKAKVRAQFQGNNVLKKSETKKKTVKYGKKKNKK